MSLLRLAAVVGSIVIAGFATVTNGGHAPPSNPPTFLERGSCGANVYIDGASDSGSATPLEAVRRFSPPEARLSARVTAVGEVVVDGSVRGRKVATYRVINDGASFVPAWRVVESAFDLCRGV